MSGPSPPPAESDYRRWPLYWFAVLENAVERGDHQAAAEAQKHLDQLGVRVCYGCPLPGKEVQRAD